MPRFRKNSALHKSLLLLGLLLCRQSFATTYYVSPKGNDAYDGKSVSHAWQTLERVNLTVNKLARGDSVLLQRGGIFAGTLKLFSDGVAISRVYVGAYGSGNNPVISGAVEIQNWKSFKNNIWMAAWPDKTNAPSDLFLDGIRLTLGRQPNSGYNSITDVVDSKIFRDTTITYPDNFWNGAEAVVRCNRWILDKLHIEYYRNNEFHLNSKLFYPVETGNEYFIQNHLATLDQPGEWFFDSAQRIIYLMLAPGTQPKAHIVTASTVDSGIVIRNATQIIVENITIKYYKKTAVEISSSDAVSLRSCAITFGGNISLHVVNCNRPSFEHNTISDTYTLGVGWENVTDGTFLSNIIRRTGMIPGRGNSGDGSYIGLYITSDNPRTGHDVIQYNQIDSTGYSAIDFRKGNVLIKNNVIRDFCLVKDDGAGIYTWHNNYDENEIEENIILGDPKRIPTQRTLISGIYMDDSSSNVLIKKNTIAYCAKAGIYIHNASRIKIIGNVIFGNGKALFENEKGQLYIRYDKPGQNSTQPELTIRKNSFTSTLENTACIYFSTDYPLNWSCFGEQDGNIYQAPNPKQAVAEIHGQQSMCEANQYFDLFFWQQLSGLDSGSVFNQISTPDYQSFGNLVVNGTFSNNTDGWAAWPSATKYEIDLSALSGQPSLRAHTADDHREALLYYNGVALNKEKIYQLSFIAMASQLGNLQFSILTMDSPWRAISSYSCFDINKEARQYTCYFHVTENCDHARLNFKFGNTLWVDNVSIREVPSETIQNDAVKLIYNVGGAPMPYSKRNFVSYGNYTTELAPFSSMVIKRP